MKITISTSGNKGRTFTDIKAANLFLRGLLGRHSDAFYSIQDGAFRRSGSIDLEPASFHKRNKERILNAHLQTFSRNILAGLNKKAWPFNAITETERKQCAEHFIELLSII